MINHDLQREPVTTQKQHKYRGRLFGYCVEVLHSLSWPHHETTSRRLGSLGITSACGGEGVSTLAAHLAATAAACDAGRVLVVDCNLARPALHGLFGVPIGPGLVEGLSGGERGAKLVQQSSFINLSVLSAGHLQGSPARIWNSPALAALVRDLAAEFELVVFDLPPVAQQSCTGRLAGLLDGVLLVVEAERVCCSAVQRAKELLVGAEAHLLGGLLNKRREMLPGWLHDHGSVGT